MNEDIVRQRLKDLQREVENARISGSGWAPAVPASVRRVLAAMNRVAAGTWRLAGKALAVRT